MKKIFFILFSVFALLASNASAYKIILQGGTRDHRFHYVYSDENRTECRGRGNLGCIMIGGTNIGGIRITFQDVTDYVQAKLDKGENKGEVMYKELLPVAWSTDAEGTTEINIKEVGTIFNK